MKPSNEQKDSQVSVENPASVRASISFPPDVYRALDEIAAKNVSLAWVVRDAAGQYIAEKWLLPRKSATWAPRE